MLAAVALTTPLAACSGLEGTGDKGYITGDGTVRQIDADDRDGPIELTGESLDGEPLDLADLRGEIAVVNVWGSWCPPCRAEMPDLVGAAEETEDVASFVGINIRESSTDTALAFNRTFDVPYPSFYSFDGQALLAFSGTITPNSIPSTIVLDPEGRVASSVIGPLPSQQTLVDLIEDVAAESAPAPRDTPGGGATGGEGSGRG